MSSCSSSTFVVIAVVATLLLLVNAQEESKSIKCRNFRAEEVRKYNTVRSKYS